ncbi:MAG: hypothetical protein EAZ80_01585 [Runella slithyformis]|nr:MAG: hypothetical protein EAZ80_01585 [Runella slithyformis]TAF48765.1 MAG: hypothetical protein EAZ63_03770 [Runella slithyformis]
MSAAESQTHVREAKNRNEHPSINLYFDACDMNMRKARWDQRPWCAAFVTWAVRQCGVPLTWLRGSLAAVATWNRAPPSRVVPQSQAAPADVVTYTYWSHQELVKEWPRNPKVPVFYAIGGNTSAGNVQHGVYTNIPRRKNSVRNIIRVI